MRIPITIPECFEFLNVVVDAESLEQIKKKKREGLVDFHMDLGLLIRNNWLYADDSPLIQTLREQGMTYYHEDTLSALIIELFWEHLHGEEYKVEDFVERLEKQPSILHLGEKGCDVISIEGFSE
jgi:hypothetical protein